MRPSSSTTLNKWKGSYLASTKRIALCSRLIFDFFDITADNRPDKRQIEELFVLTWA